MSDDAKREATPGDKTLVDKAREAASEIDVKEMVDKAKVTAIDVKDKVTHFVGEHEHQIGSAIDKTGHFVDEKLTRYKFSDKIDKAQEVAKGAVNKIGHAGEETVPAEKAAIETGNQSQPEAG